MDDPRPGTADDAALATAIARGDSAAETALFERFAPRVLFLARRELRSPHLAEEARSETFLRALQAIRGGRLRSPESLAAFVLQTTRYVILELVRRRQREPGSLDEDEAEMAAAPEQEEPEAEVIESVRETLIGLPARDRRFLKMYYYEERPKEDIARELGIDDARVRLIKSRALQRFRHAYTRRAERRR